MRFPVSVGIMFINDPSDRIKIAKIKALKISSDFDSIGRIEWFPKKKIFLAKDKLNGIIPIEILSCELENN